MDRKLQFAKSTELGFSTRSSLSLKTDHELYFADHYYLLIYPIESSSLNRGGLYQPKTPPWTA
jgi:hypothetical protein